MRKTIFLGLLVISYLHSLGQARFGILGGAVFAKTNEELSDKSRVGIFVGGITELKLGKSISFRPQLRFVTKGQQNVSGAKGSYNYFEIPFDFVYNVPTSAGRLSFGAGPALAYMVKGTWSEVGASKEEIHFDYDEVNQMDFGINTVAGFEIKGGIFFTLHYTLGLRDVWTSDEVGTNKNRAFGIGIGIMFKG